MTNAEFALANIKVHEGGGRLSKIQKIYKESSRITILGSHYIYGVIHAGTRMIVFHTDFHNLTSNFDKPKLLADDGLGIVELREEEILRFDLKNKTPVGRNNIKSVIAV